MVLLTGVKARSLAARGTWLALYVMIRGNYPESAGVVVGADIPRFLQVNCHMHVSPARLAHHLASFSLRKLPFGWIMRIPWNTMAQSMRNRLGQGIAGYRYLGHS